ncbi:MAG TPA: CAP domain-containing protein [Candidatus Limnocylindria bacterium]
MIRASTFDTTLRSLAIAVALVVQIVAIAVIGDVFHDVFASKPSVDAAAAPTSETVARVALAARGDRLMTINLALDVAAVDLAATAPVRDAELVSDASGALPEPVADTAVAPADGAPEAAPPLVAETTPQPRPDPTAAPRPIAAAPAITTSPTTVEAELRMLYLMNTSRMQAGLVPLALDTGVSDVARKHSAAEAQVRYVYHDGPDGTAHSRYVPACGTGWYGENTGKVWSGGVEVLHREFMAEPWEPINHRTNIMDPNFRRVGIGAVQGPDAVYITMAFCR